MRARAARASGCRADAHKIALEGLHECRGHSVAFGTFDWVKHGGRLSATAISIVLRVAKIEPLSGSATYGLVDRHQRRFEGIVGSSTLGHHAHAPAAADIAFEHAAMLQ
jgi:hypothetical protein